MQGTILDIGGVYTLSLHEPSILVGCLMVLSGMEKNKAGPQG